MIDLRSDTVTKPTAEMRRAMAEAEVGDDVYGEDPTVNKLEERAAAVFGKEAALYVPTGTMGNTIAIKLLTEHGQEVICDDKAHIFNYEMSMMAWFAGCVARPIATTDGVLTWDDIRPHYRPVSANIAPTGLVEVETTHNMGGGTVYPLPVLDEIQEEARKLSLPIHMDGARIFNAAAYLDVPVSRIAQTADTVQFCLSKGLGAPAGSMLVGPRKLIAKGRLYRKRLGGGMRQVGVLAAAGLIALEKMPANLKMDHANARLLAEGLATVPGVTLDPGRVQTNIVIFDVSEALVDCRALSAALKQNGVLANAISPTAMRMVTHYDVTAEDCKKAIRIVRETLQLLGAPRPTRERQVVRG